MPSLLEIPEDVRRANEIWRGTNSDRRAVVETDNGQRALGGETVAMKNLAHQHGVDHLIEFSGAAGIAPTVIACFHRAVGKLRSGAEAGRAGAAAGDVPRHARGLDRTIPDGPPVAAGQAALVFVLGL